MLPIQSIYFRCFWDIYNTWQILTDISAIYQIWFYQKYLYFLLRSLPLHISFLRIYVRSSYLFEYFCFWEPPSPPTPVAMLKFSGGKLKCAPEFALSWFGLVRKCRRWASVHCAARLVYLHNIGLDGASTMLTDQALSMEGSCLVLWGLSIRRLYIRTCCLQYKGCCRTSRGM